MAPSVELYRGEVLDLESFVKNATWREVLMELVDKNKIDPWDIDITEITDHYIEAISHMKVLDLHIPANIILAASILLRMKSEMLILVENEEPVISDEAGANRVIPEVPSLVSRLRLQPGKRITLSELIDALGDAMKLQQAHSQAASVPKIPISMPVNTEDIDAKLDKVYTLVKNNIDKEYMTTFKYLLNNFSSAESALLDLFVPLLLLMQQSRLKLRQDVFFSEIFIMLNESGGNA